MIRIHPAVLITVLLPLCGLLSPLQLAILWSAAILHESAHLIAYRRLGHAMESVTLIPVGLVAIPRDSWKIPPLHEILCAAAGPLCNLGLCLLLLASPLPADSEEVRYMLYCNLALGITNLLPILPLDGGRILYYGMALRFDPQICETVCRRTALMLLIPLFYPVAEGLLLDRNPSFALIWGYLLIYTFAKRGSI
ncbi:MAG: site-2 protease family protein [Clostridia bacterium]|nr:site-2 protease family protein [Clostridia bacterium]